MDDRLLNYYERELTFFREMAVEFARKYPKIAGRLQLEADKCEDPHTERLIEAFALISGRIHKKIDDDFPEITESVLNIVYPHYTNPIPSMTVVRFEPVEKTITPAGYTIDRDTPLYSRPVGGFPCQFATCYPITLWPVEVASAEVQEPKRQLRGSQEAIVLGLKTFNNIAFSQIGWDRLRFYLHGQHQHVFHIYELLLNGVCQVECEWVNRQGKVETYILAPDAVKAVGFAPDEGMVPFPRRSFPGYLLLFEYFCFPEKFLFFDLTGLDRLGSFDIGDTLSLIFYLDRSPKKGLHLSAETFCLNAAPAVNLFKRIAEPVQVEHRKTEYRVIPDVRRQEATEIFSVDRVTAFSLSSPDKTFDLKPFYSIRHHLDEDDEDQGRRAFWHTLRHPSRRHGDDGTEVNLSFTDLDLNPAEPEVETLTVHVTCSNRDLPSRLPFGAPTGDFDMEVAAPVNRITCLIKPTPTRRPTLGGALHWRLISHLSLNYISLAHEGVDALREILRLYDFDNSPATRQQINGIVSLESAFVTKRIGQSFCRGVQVTIDFDEDRFVGAGLYLFASILESFLGQYVSVNSFSQLVARAIQRKEPVKKWPPRNGCKILL